MHNCIRKARMPMLAMLLGVHSASAATFSVTNANPSGPGSLRDAVAAAEANNNSPTRLATVHHEAIDGQPDTHPEDDDCPRAALPGGVDDNAGKPIKDKGCGNKDKVTKQLGADVLTDVVVK